MPLSASSQSDLGPSRLPTQALEALPDPILIVEGGDPNDLAGRVILFANEAARDLLRIPREGALLISAVRDPNVLEVLDEAMFGRAKRSIDFTSGGSQERHWRAYAAPLDAGGETNVALLRLRDQTESRRMERMRVDFLANASHELRTPLASLSGFIETLKGHAREDEAARDRFLDIMAAQADRMGRLVADLLSLSRIELNEHIPPAGRAELGMLVGDVVDALELLASNAGVRLDLTGGRAPGAVVTGDRDELIQVAQNLIDNAVKYSSRGGSVDIEVRTGLTAEQAVEPAMPGAPRFSLLTPDRDETVRYSRLTVRDHGPGMARENLPRLTERFYRVEGQKSGERLGTGLGLAIVKHITNRHRGGLIVESRAGEGAAFTVYLPLLARHQPAVLIEDERRNRTVTQPS